MTFVTQPMLHAELLKLLQSSAPFEEVKDFVDEHPDSLGWHLNTYGCALNQVAQRDRGVGGEEGEALRLQLAAFFLERGADVNGFSQHGITPLNAAVYFCNYPMAHLLLNHDADASLGFTSYHAKRFEGMEDFLAMNALQREFFIACLPKMEEKSARIRQELEQEVKKLGVDTEMALATWAHEGDIPRLSAMLESLPRHVVNLSLRKDEIAYPIAPLLIHAVAAGQNDMVRFLVQERGAFVHGEDAVGNTALQWAFVKEHYDTARLLIDLGVDGEPAFERSTNGGFSGLEEMTQDDAAAQAVLNYAMEKKLRAGLRGAIAIPKERLKLQALKK